MVVTHLDLIIKWLLYTSKVAPTELLHLATSGIMYQCIPVLIITMVTVVYLAESA
jgi:hypothetical protein